MKKTSKVQKTPTMTLTARNKMPRKSKVAKTSPVVTPAVVVAPAPTPVATTPKVDVPPSARMFRPGTCVETLYNALADGKDHTTVDLFKALNSQDPGQIITDLRRIGKKLDAFKIELAGKGTYKLVTL